MICRVCTLTEYFKIPTLLLQVLSQACDGMVITECYAGGYLQVGSEGNSIREAYTSPQMFSLGSKPNIMLILIKQDNGMNVHYSIFFFSACL